MNIPEFIMEIVEAGIPVTLLKDGFEIEGFYKSGNIKVKQHEDGIWKAYARYNEVDSVEDIKDIVAINHYWWQSSKDRFEGWQQPDCRWVGLLEKYGYITKKVIPQQEVWK